MLDRLALPRGYLAADRLGWNVHFFYDWSFSPDAGMRIVCWRAPGKMESAVRRRFFSAEVTREPVKVRRLAGSFQ